MRILVTFAAVVLLATPAWANMMNNGDMESGGHDSLPGWTKYGNQGNLITQDLTENTPTGPAEGLHWGGHGGGSPGGEYRGFWQIVDISSATKGSVELTGYVRMRTAGTGGVGHLEIQPKNGDMTAWSSTFAVPTPGEWMAFDSGELDYGTTTSVQVNIYMVAGNGWGAHSLHADGIELNDVPEPAGLALLALGGLPFLRRRR